MQSILDTMISRKKKNLKTQKTHIPTQISEIFFVSKYGLIFFRLNVVLLTAQLS